MKIFKTISPLLLIAGVFLLLAIFLGIAVFSGIFNLKESAPVVRNILLITLDTVRPDRLSCYGYRGIKTENIDRIAAAGVIFQQALTTVPVTLPAHSSLMTGKEVYSHGVRGNGEYRLRNEFTTLAEILAGDGYQTAAFIGAFPLDRRFGLAQGFQHYEDDIAKEGKEQRNWRGHKVERFERNAEEVTDLSLDWLKMHGQDNFFIWIHYFDAHQPYEPPDKYRRDNSRTTYQAYNGEIEFIDDQFGRILEYLESAQLINDTLVILVSDHGEVLDDYRDLIEKEPYNNHGISVNEGELRVAFIMMKKGLLPEGKTIGEMVRISDIAPTILDIIGDNREYNFDGSSLFSTICQDNPRGLESIYCELEEEYDISSMRTDREKIVISPLLKDMLVFNFKKDREEKNPQIINIEGESDYKSLIRQLNSFRRSAHIEGERSKIILDPTAREKLRALGYLK